MFAPSAQRRAQHSCSANNYFDEELLEELESGPTSSCGERSDGQCPESDEFSSSAATSSAGTPRAASGNTLSHGGPWIMVTVQASQCRCLCHRASASKPGGSFFLLYRWLSMHQALSNFTVLSAASGPGPGTDKVFFALNCCVSASVKWARGLVSTMLFQL